MPANARGDEERQTSGHEHPNGPRIVAGIDGSASSMSALRWAIRQAVLTGAAVDAVIAWHYPVAVGGYGWAPDRGSRRQPGGSVTPEQQLRCSVPIAWTGSWSAARAWTPGSSPPLCSPAPDPHGARTRRPATGGRG